MTAYAQNKTEKTLQDDDCKVVKIRCSSFGKYVGTYPQKRALAPLNHSPDEQWEHYTDTQEKCKCFVGI